MAFDPDKRRRRRPKPGPNLSHLSEEERKQFLLEQKLNTPIAEMALAVRIVNMLEEHDVIVCRDLLRQTYESLAAMTNLGEKTLQECRQAVEALGLPAPEWQKPVREAKPTKSGQKSLFNFW